MPDDVPETNTTQSLRPPRTNSPRQRSPATACSCRHKGGVRPRCALAEPPRSGPVAQALGRALLRKLSVRPCCASSRSGPVAQALGRALLRKLSVRPCCASSRSDPVAQALGQTLLRKLSGAHERLSNAQGRATAREAETGISRHAEARLTTQSLGLPRTMPFESTRQCQSGHQPMALWGQRQE
ncbi:uncharacterized protein M421DRAFT_342596 [Didymella exigua CBS 183.55]|uniref:Uncharacterized protein n=1 Tax=Didymella exigua CBS 183.55 TaxID=1150837 RepID=A0A6A5RY83_9PLEO|nr:uncharacterized protein M421DRAFT_342596 [Didymella exigua CBS 183.55]KAF1931256.1 hypothetical protein M421DRAFT_342596 [Didymella exigua CBS 183.55]